MLKGSRADVVRQFRKAAQNSVSSHLVSVVIDPDTKKATMYASGSVESLIYAAAAILVRAKVAYEPERQKIIDGVLEALHLEGHFLQ